MYLKRLIIALFLVLSSGLYGQSFHKQRDSEKSNFSVNLKNVTTRSIRGWKTGPSMELEVGSRFSLSYVYLTSTSTVEEESEVFSGAQMNYSFIRSKKWQASIGLRSGVYNRQFISVLPSIQTRYNASDRLFAELAYASCDGAPFFQMGLGYKVIRK